MEYAVVAIPCTLRILVTDNIYIVTRRIKTFINDDVNQLH